MLNSEVHTRMETVTPIIVAGWLMVGRFALSGRLLGSGITWSGLIVVSCNCPQREESVGNDRKRCRTLSKHSNESPVALSLGLGCIFLHFLLTLLSNPRLRHTAVDV